MVAGHLQEKNGLFYIVLTYPDAAGKRKNKWISTKLPVKGNKKKAEKMLLETRKTFVPAEKPLDNDIKFSDYMLQWLEIVKPTIATTTYASYSFIVKSVVVPYFKKADTTLCGLKAIDIQTFYLYELKRVSASTVIHYHALLHRALKYAVKIELIEVNPADKVDRPKANRFVGSFYDSDEVQELFKERSDRFEVGCYRLSEQHDHNPPHSHILLHRRQKSPGGTRHDQDEIQHEDAAPGAGIQGFAFRKGKTAS